MSFNFFYRPGLTWIYEIALMIFGYWWVGWPGVILVCLTAIQPAITFQ